MNHFSARQQDLMNEVDEVVNKITAHITLEMYHYAKRTKIAIITTPDHLSWLQSRYQEQLKQFESALQDALAAITPHEDVVQADHHQADHHQADHDHSRSPTPTYQRPTVKHSSTTTTEEETGEVLRCPGCPREYHQMISIVRHLLINHWNCDECPYCGMEDKSSQRLAQHILQEHEGVTLLQLTTKMNIVPDNEDEDEQEQQPTNHKRTKH